MFHIDCILKGPKPTKIDHLGYGWVALIKAEQHVTNYDDENGDENDDDEDEDDENNENDDHENDEDKGYTQVGVSFLVPRVFSLLEIGWHAVDVGTQDVFAK